MAGTNLPTPEDLRNLLEYDPETGVIRYREAWPELFQSDGKMSQEARCSKWNANHGFSVAFQTVSAQGYLVGSVLKAKCSAHRVAHLLMTGKWPVEIDHMNGDRTDNRWVNLREVTRRSNSRNAAISANNTSGFGGVSWRRDQGKWRASIMVDGKSTSLGVFANKQDAMDARTEANLKHGFTDRHGK